MAKIITDPKDIPERTKPIPGAKPPVHGNPYAESFDPKEVNDFNEYIRQLRQGDLKKTA